ncbi:MAG TPA: hypothetical protein VJZ03_05880 [Candidatus Bathyarchaeia archaeon]|nr:hypothetical protein [Candidatus Bathyarchaeia archaeon]
MFNDVESGFHGLKIRIYYLVTLDPYKEVGVFLNNQMLIRVLVLVDALLMAVGHVPIIRAIFFSFPIGAYFVFATVVYVLGGVFVVANRLFRLSNASLIILAIVDNILLIYTRELPNFFFHRILPWSWGWLPPGTGQICIGQALLVVFCGYLLYEPRLQETHKAKPSVPVASKVQ